MRRLLIAVGLGLFSAVALPLAASAQSGSLILDPATVTPGGGKLFINGSCEANTSGFLISHAFAGQPSVGQFAGVPAVAITTDGSGTFGIGLTIAPTVKAGRYSVILRSGGGLAASATLTVRSAGLANTGAATEVIAAAGGTVLAIGLALALLGRRRSQTSMTQPLS
jgi:LPXTG-motif cell wall-anchored protein